MFGGKTYTVLLLAVYYYVCENENPRGVGSNGEPIIISLLPEAVQVSVNNNQVRIEPNHPFRLHRKFKVELFTVKWFLLGLLHRSRLQQLTGK